MIGFPGLQKQTNKTKNKWQLVWMLKKKIKGKKSKGKKRKKKERKSCMQQTLTQSDEILYTRASCFKFKLNIDATSL